MKIEKLLGKFGIKGITYGPRTGGQPLLSVEEQLAAVGICWSESPVGWLLLFVEGLEDVYALKQLHTATMGEALREMQSWRGTYPEKALHALCVTAIAEATQQFGQICPECEGAGKVLSKCKHSRKCPCCTEGRIKWTNETRFAYFAQTLPVTYSRFNRYKLVLENMVDWLTCNRTVALLAIQGRIEKEEREARREVA